MIDGNLPANILLGGNNCSMKPLKFEVFEHQLLVTSSHDGWAVYYLGAEGKKRPATDIVVP